MRFYSFLLWSQVLTVHHYWGNIPKLDCLTNTLITFILQPLLLKVYLTMRLNNNRFV
jgi:hypothetical protein